MGVSFPHRMLHKLPIAVAFGAPRVCQGVAMSLVVCAMLGKIGRLSTRITSEAEIPTITEAKCAMVVATEGTACGRRL